MSDRWQVCEDCSGDGGHESNPQPHGVTHWITCNNCGGNGGYWVEDEAMTMEDALELDQQKLDALTQQDDTEKSQDQSS